MEHYGTPIGYGVSAGLAAGLAHGYLGKNQGLGVLFRYVPAGAAAGYLYARHTRGREKRSHFLGSGLGKEAGYEGLRALDSKAVNRKLVIHQAKKALGRPT
jgi:hypothetical protein